ncbi:hypothetical protein [Streptomyces sp. 061-3]|uniref:hypothetical protein n=1 Tax=Streptomyces sp. 061-3 TaxID=2789268 RepID=UPI003980D1B6
MGSQLRRDLREALGPDIKGLPRSVALEIADDARYDDDGRYDPDKGRRSKATLEELRRWTASKDTNVVRDALKRLSAAGWEFRLPIGKGKDGRVLYAVPGRAVEFRVPDFDLKGESPLPLPRKGESGLALGVVTTPSEGVTTPCRASQDYPPISFITDPPTSPSSSAAQVELAEVDAPKAPAGKPAGRTRKPKTPAEKKHNPHQVADDLADAFWKVHGKGRAQGFLAIRGVVRTAIKNGVERDDLARALDHVAREARYSISGSTIDVALNKIKRPGGRHQAHQDPEDQNVYDEEVA